MHTAEEGALMRSGSEFVHGDGRRIDYEKDVNVRAEDITNIVTDDDNDYTYDENYTGGSNE